MGYDDDPNYTATPDSLSAEQEDIYEKLVAREPSDLVVDNPGMMPDIVNSVLEYRYGDDFELDESVAALLIMAGWFDAEIREGAETGNYFCPWCESRGYANEYRGEHAPDAEIDCPVCNC